MENLYKAAASGQTSADAGRVRTDLAAERAGALPDEPGRLRGVRSREENLRGGRMIRVEVLDEAGARAVGKPVGQYATLRLPPFGRGQERDATLTEAAADALREMLPDGPCLVVGLGNQDITPDALGPRAAEKILPTRHVTGETALPGFEALRPVAVIAPGVLGQTGMESGEIASALIGLLRPSCLIAIDALAAGSRDWLACTVQMTDTGIAPGSGVQNRRRELSAATLGVPVAAVGVPTVMDAPSPEGEPMIVTPREVDRLIDDAADFVAMAVNRALFPELAPEDIRALMN